jgi:ATP-dependent protease HslVU (ClpYQ) peptidase subunit
MTCIAGVVGGDGRVYVGGDSAGVSGWSIVTRADEKVFRRGEWIFGFTSSFRMGQLIRYALDLPVPPSRGIERFMATTFIDALRKTLKEGGCAQVENGVETGGAFLVGLRGRLFIVDSDFQVGESRDGFAAVGCGQAEACGALRVLGRHSKLAPRKQVLAGLEAASYLNGAVAPPFVVVSA